MRSPQQQASDRSAALELHPSDSGVSLRDFGDLSDSDLTYAFEAAIEYIRSLPNGGRLLIPPGRFSTRRIDCTGIGIGTTQRIEICGCGPGITTIVGIESDVAVIDMSGTHAASVRDLSITSGPSAIPHCGILLARTQQYQSCGKFVSSDVKIVGAFSIAAAVAIAAECGVWYSPHFQNTYRPAKRRCFWTGPGNYCNAVSAAGEILDSTNTANVMYSPFFYGPYDDAELVTMVKAAGYSFFGATVLVGDHPGEALVGYYADPVAYRFTGPVNWYGCLFECSHSAAHYLYGVAGLKYFDGINVYGGYYCYYNAVGYLLKTNDNGSTISVGLANSTWLKPAIGGQETRFSVANCYASTIDILSSFATKTQIAVATQSNCVFRASEILSNYRKESSASSSPTSGSWTVGDWVWNTKSTDIEYLGLIAWECAVAGTPGTWVPVYRGWRSGATGSRPGGSPIAGLYYWDTTLGKPIWATGSGAWKDATGAAI